jgi:hypothetical protein
MTPQTVTPNCAKCRKPTTYLVPTPVTQLYWCDDCTEPAQGSTEQQAHWETQLDPYGEDEELFGTFSCPYCGRELISDYSVCFDCYHN